VQHPILLYMRKEKIRTQTEFARLVGLSPQYVNDLIHGRAGCGRNAALKIRQGTQNGISLEALVTWKTGPTETAA
jgi:DNA-binding transcriptional regulator YdaS (Cro superfamily)